MHRISAFIIILILGLFSILSLFHSGLIPTHDGEYHVVRFYEFNKTLLGGQLYPRWAPDFNKGYGLPIFNYNYPLPNYFAFFFHGLGFSFIDSFKIELIVATLAGGIFFFLWSRVFWGTIGGIVSSVAYIYSPYRLVDIFVRGSVGEVLALCFFPGFLWSVTVFIRKKERKFFIFSVLFLSLVIFSHNILAYMFFLFSILYTIFLLVIERAVRQTWIVSFFILFLSIGLTGIFWVPALFERQYVQGLEIFDYRNHFPEIYQLIFPSWGTGFSNSSLGNEMSFQIGLVNFFSLFLSIVCLFLFKERNLRKIIAFFIIMFVIIFFLMLDKSLFIWEHFPLLNYFQFPWRLLSLEVIITSFLGGSLWRTDLLKKSIKSYFACFLLIIVVLLATKEYIKPAYYLERNDAYYVTRSNFIDSTNTPGNAFNTIWIKSGLKHASGKIKFDRGDSRIITQVIKPTHYSLLLDLKKNAEINIQTAYFPGWIAIIDGNRINLSPDKNGLMNLDVTASVKNLEIVFINTTIRKTAELISLLSLAFLILIYFKFDKLYATVSYGKAK